jgi:hypothetical protein
LFVVDGPAERDDFDLAGLAGGRGGAGQAGQGLGSGEPAAGVFDLGEQPGGPDDAGFGQRGKDRGVRVGGELVGDVLVQDRSARAAR